MTGGVMDLIKNSWKKADFSEFHKYEQSLKGSARDCEWEQKIVNTKLECFARTSTKARVAAKEIKKGAYLEFLDGLEIGNMFDSLVYAHLISSIKDFDVFEKYLDKFVLTIDSWASADTLRFAKKDKERLVKLSNKYLKDERPFVRRVGVNIWFELIKDNHYIDKAFCLLDSLKDEDEYYVNMSGAWLLSFCMIYDREKTIRYFENDQTNKFIVNKGISKCRDSYRVSAEDKQLLLGFKVK